jgi:hypothetical protein
MKKIVSVLISLMMVATVAVGAAGCDGIGDAVSDALTSAITSLVTDLENELDPTTTTSTTSKTTTTTTTSKTNTASGMIPYIQPPEIVPYTLPKENFTDPLEKDASDIIDGAIAKAISYVNAMKDNRHSDISYSYDIDSDKYYSALDANEKALYNQVIAAAREGKDFEITDDQYKGDLEEAFFDICQIIEVCEPGIASYFDLEPVIAADFIDLGTVDEDGDPEYDIITKFTSIHSFYFDPHNDQNTSVKEGKVTKNTVLRDADLLDHIVKRIIRFMPEGLSTYDKYYYFAAVISERATYDGRPKNCFSAFGALVDGKCVCEGYSEAFYLLCKEADLWVSYRHGLPLDSDGEPAGHQWNMVKLNTGIYNVDVTWCDGSDYYDAYRYGWYDCFVKTDADFIKDGHEAYNDRVVSTGQYEPTPYDEIKGA